MHIRIRLTDGRINDQIGQTENQFKTHTEALKDTG